MSPCRTPTLAAFMVCLLLMVWCGNTVKNEASDCKRCQKLTKWMRVIWNNSLNQDEVIDKQGSVTVRKANHGRGESHRQDGGVTSASGDTYLNTKGSCKIFGETDRMDKYLRYRCTSETETECYVTRKFIEGRLLSHSSLTHSLCLVHYPSVA